MPLFHPRILKKQIESIPTDSAHIALLNQWAENLNRGIYDSETQNDSEFIQRILIDVLGYTGSSAGQTWTAAKNQPVGNGNVDVALGHFTADSVRILAPFELKGAKTCLDAVMPGYKMTPVQQAWNYANDTEDAKWVLVSNYREIRLYAYGKGRKNYESFDMTALTGTQSAEHYKRFMLLLSAKNLLGGTTLALLNESGQTEKAVTDGFYKEYKDFRKRLVETITQDNPDKDKLDIIHHTQTILDRILFIAFAEDRGLLPQNTLETAYQEVSRYNPQPIWANFVGLFKSINEGNSRLNIPEYNGGLFADDPELNALKVRDELCKGFQNIGQYDFDSEISVNILGHIFEQSISDLEELRAAAKGEAGTPDKKKSKKKADGVFYTPPYITHYIVEQAVGSYLADKRREIGFDSLPELTDADYDRMKQSKGKRKGQTENIDKHIKAWKDYESALSAIKVLDPACGSGAFLIEVFDYLYREGQTINNELARLQGGQGSLFRWDKHILANNLYGVDLNRESVEITKLSLWLKTAKRDEKLTYLENNIKTGNSLIDDKTVAGGLAFVSQEEFHDIMANGGFDVVVGNPPYYNIETLGVGNPQAQWIQNNYPDIWQDKSDILFYFIHKALALSKGDIGYIVSNAFLFSDKAQKLRNHILQDGRLSKIVNFEQYLVFDDASITTGIFIFNKNHDGIKAVVLKDKDYSVDDVVTIINDENNAFTIDLKEDHVYALVPDTIAKLNIKIDGEHTKLEELCCLGKGMETAADSVFLFDAYPKQFPKQYIKKRVTGKNIDRYVIGQESDYILYFEDVEDFEELPLSVRKHLETHRKKLTERAEIKRKADAKWWKYTFPLHKEFYHLPKLYCSRRAFHNTFCFDDSFEYMGFSNMTVIFETNPDISVKYVLALLNSQLLNYRYKSIGKQTGGGSFEYFPNGVGKLPIPKIDLAGQQPFIDLADRMLLLHSELRKRRTDFQELCLDNLGVTLSDKRFGEIGEFKDFLEELKRQKVLIPHDEQPQWKESFCKCKSEVASILESLCETDAKIDCLVYRLYGLTPEEIAIVSPT